VPGTHDRTTMVRKIIIFGLKKGKNRLKWLNPGYIVLCSSASNLYIDTLIGKRLNSKKSNIMGISYQIVQKKTRIAGKSLNSRKKSCNEQLDKKKKTKLHLH